MSSLLYEGTIYNDEVKWGDSSFKESDSYKTRLLITLTHLVFLPYNRKADIRQNYFIFPESLLYVFGSTRG